MGDPWSGDRWRRIEQRYGEGPPPPANGDAMGPEFCREAVAMMDMANIENNASMGVYRHLENTTQWALCRGTMQEAMARFAPTAAHSFEMQEYGELMHAQRAQVTARLMQRIRRSDSPASMAAQGVLGATARYAPIIVQQWLTEILEQAVRRIDTNVSTNAQWVAVVAAAGALYSSNPELVASAVPNSASTSIFRGQGSFGSWNVGITAGGLQRYVRSPSEISVSDIVGNAKLTFQFQARF